MSSAAAGFRPLRILQVNSLLNGGGTDDQCLKLCQGLIARGQHVWLSGPADRPCYEVARSLGIPVLPTPPEGKLRLGAIHALARQCQEHRIDILHGHNGRDLWPTILAARWSGVRPRVVLTRHLAKSPSSWLSRRFLLGHCDALIAVSRFTERILREGVEEPNSPVEERRSRPPLRGDHRKIRVVYGGVDPERFRPFDAREQRAAWGLQPTDFAFGVVGGYPKPRGKGQREFLLAAAELHAAFPQARFLVVGRGGLGDSLRADIERLGLAGRAWLTPYCTDMPAAMNALDCLVHPQVATEAFGMVVVEAMACGKPVIATACDGIPEMLEPDRFGVIVPMEDPGALAGAMRRMLTDAAWREQLVHGGRDHVLRHFTLAQLTEGVLRVYRECLVGS